MTVRGTLGSAEAYPIAWIAPQAHDRTAATAVLDERHNEPHGFNGQKHAHDQNSYSWGRIGHHCIVIASLPPGEYDSTNTALIVQGLRYSLPHLRFGLLVGTGAGLPGEKINRSGETVAKRDIRLGDVVVASSGLGGDGSLRGLVQYDWIVTGDKQPYLSRSDFPEPPAVLRAAMSTLQSEHELDGSKIDEILQSAFTRFPSIKKLYSNPGVEKEWDEEDSETESDSDDEQSFTPDKLFLASCDHFGGLKDCSACAPNGEVKRKKRKTSSPKVHFGTAILFKSAIKAASQRENIVASLEEQYANAMCIDAESFGFRADFPCLLIKGICDYGDAHWNDRWQKYAALTAAAFARELLGFVTAGDVERTHSISEIMRH